MTLNDEHKISITFHKNDQASIVNSLSTKIQMWHCKQKDLQINYNLVKLSVLHHPPIAVTENLWRCLNLLDTFSYQFKLVIYMYSLKEKVNDKSQREGK